MYTPVYHAFNDNEKTHAHIAKRPQNRHSKEWGTSPALRLSTAVLKEAGCQLEQKVDLVVSRGRIMIGGGTVLEALIASSSESRATAWCGWPLREAATSTLTSGLIEHRANFAASNDASAIVGSLVRRDV
jgi:hypothetical protein